MKKFYFCSHPRRNFSTFHLVSHKNLRGEVMFYALRDFLMEFKQCLLSHTMKPAKIWKFKIKFLNSLYSNPPRDHPSLNPKLLPHEICINLISTRKLISNIEKICMPFWKHIHMLLLWLLFISLPRRTSVTPDYFTLNYDLFIKRKS